MPPGHSSPSRACMRASASSSLNAATPLCPRGMENDSDAPLPRRPTFGRSAGERLKSGRSAGAETGHWHIRLGSRGGDEAAAVRRCRGGYD